MREPLANGKPFSLAPDDDLRSVARRESVIVPDEDGHLDSDFDFAARYAAWLLNQRGR